MSIFLSSQIVLSSETLRWAAIKWAPVMFLSGENKGQGFQEWYLEYFQEKLPHYKHENYEVNFSRIYHELEKGSHFCHVLALKTPEREKFLAFSLPYVVVATPKLFFTKEAWKDLGKPEKYSLKKLGEDKRFQGVIEGNRSFTSKLDNFINEAVKVGHLERHILKSENIIRMLKKKRIHYTIEYPFTVVYEGAENLVEVEIEEIDPFTYSHVVCPKNTWGEKKISEINQIIKKGLKEEEFKKRMLAWQTPKAQKIVKENYQKLLNDADVR